MKNILMITPFFAPYSHAAVYRAHRFAKYLPRFGWKPYVLTVDRSFLYFIDESLLDDLPKDVEIIRARHIDITYSGLKSLFEKVPTDSRLIKGPTSSDLTAKLQKQKKKNFIKDIIYKIEKELLFLPDRYITWYPFALKEAKEIIASRRIEALYSTFSPFTSHLIAMKLKKQFKIPWVADFRDPGVEEKRIEFYSTHLSHAINSIVEKKVMKNADLVLTICEGARDVLLSKYKEIINNKITFIRTGTDIEILQTAKPRKENNKFTIIFTGEFRQLYNRFLFQLLKVIFERNLFERKNVEVLIIGSIKRNISLKNKIEFLGLSDVVKFIDYLSSDDYFSILLSADATLLPGVLKGTFPIKLTDYLFTKKPVITFDATKEVYSFLERSGLGFFIPDKIENAVEMLLNLLKGNYKFNINEDYISKFSAFNQTKELSDALTRLIEKDR